MTQPTVSMQQQQPQQQQLDDPESELLLLKLEREHRQQQQQQQQQQLEQQQLEQQQQERQQQERQQQERQQQEQQQQQPQQQQFEQSQEQGLEHEQQQDEDTQPDVPPARVGGRNVTLTNANRRDICLQRAAHPAMTLEALAIWAQLEFNLSRKPAMGTLSRILSKQSRYSSMSEIELQGQRKRNVLCSELDDALLMWVRENQERNIHVSYKMIIQKAKELGAYIKTLPGRETTEVPAFSNGWVSGFTKRHHLIGTALNAPGASSLVAINELVAGGFAPAILPLSTDEQLISRSLAAKAARAAAEQQMQQMQHENFMEDHDIDHRMDGEEMNNADAMMEGIESDIHHQMVHAVGPDSQPSSSSTSTSNSGLVQTPADGPTAPIVSPVAPPVKTRRGRKKSTGLVLQSREQLRQQAHPAAPGMVSAARSRGSPPPMTPSSSALLAQSLQQQQQQLQHLQQQAQFNQQALSPTAASNGSLEAAAAAAAAVVATTTTGASVATTAKAAGSTSTSSAGGTSSGGSPTTRQIPTKAEALAAVQTVINSLNVHIPAEVDLLRPLFDMERRLQNELHAGERQPTTTMIWSK